MKTYLVSGIYGLLALLLALTACSPQQQEQQTGQQQQQETAAAEASAETVPPPQEAAAVSWDSTTPIEGMSFAGTPLYRNPVDPQRLEPMAARQQALESSDPLLEDEYIELGRLYIAANRFRDAINLYSRGIEAYPESFRLRRHRGHRYLNVRELDNAIADLEEAVRLIGDEHKEVLEYDGEGNATGTYEHWVWYHIGLYHYLHRNWEQAAAAYRICVDTATRNQGLVGSSDWLYTTLRNNGQDQAAQAVIDAIAADIDTNREHPYFKRVMVYKGESSPEQVMDIAKPALEWTGFDVTAGYGIANWYRWQGESDTADMILDKIIATPFWNSWAYVVTDRELAERQQ